MNDKTTIQEALEELNKLDCKDHTLHENDWIISDEDNILDPWRNEKRLQEGLDVVDWTSIAPCDILYCATEVQHSNEIPKRRPMVALFKSGSADNPTVTGMQITTIPPGEGFRSKFKYKLRDWAQIGLVKQSYINYDHLVKNINDDIRNTNHMRITIKDAKGLLSCLERDYSDLIKYGYSSTYSKELLDTFITTLRSI
jgi:hypothetical protein